MTKLKFVWDEDKRAANIAKHGVDFTEAVNFDFGSALLKQDTRFDYGEDRYQSLGLIGKALYMLVWSPRQPLIVRVISLRLADEKEIRNYVAAKRKK